MKYFLTTVLSISGLAAAAEKGFSGQIETKDGGLGGTVMVVNDTTLSISSYTLEDASAPALYWWGATDSDLPNGFRINNERVDESASSDEITIPLDNGYTANDFSYVGLYDLTKGRIVCRGERRRRTGGRRRRRR